jgi:diguanylate cyclase (GGDEF)-like protein
MPLKGNVTELRDLIERAFETACDGAEITPSAIETVALRQTRKGNFVEPWANCSLEEEIRHYEGRLIRLALNAAQARITRAARLLGVTHQSLAFIIDSRHKELLGQRQPVRKRRSSIIRPALKKALEKERRLARTDELTGVANKRAFHERLAAEIQRPASRKRTFTVAFLDVDDFKRVNDQRGHGVGDALLKVIAESIRASLRSADVVARLGGDEFAILLPETGHESAPAVLQIVQENLRAAVQALGAPVTLSIGAVACVNPKCTSEEIVDLADRQMYAVKSGQKGSIKLVTLEESNPLQA